MAYDAGLAEVLRGDLTDLPGFTERSMFGGLCFLLNGNMLCGVHPAGGMFRVGRSNAALALRVEGATPMAFTGRPMGGMVDMTDEALADDARRGVLMGLAVDFVGGLPPK